MGKSSRSQVLIDKTCHHTKLFPISGNDIDFDGSASSGTGPMEIQCTTPGRIVALGDPGYTAQMNIDANEVGRIACEGLMLGGPICGHQRVGGISDATSSNILGIVTLLANRDDQWVTFQGAGATFAALSVQADNAVYVKTDVTSTTGILYLDADLEDSYYQDSINTLKFTDAVTVTAKTLITLESTTYQIQPTGRLTLQAGAGIVVLDTTEVTSLNTFLVFNADHVEEGDGTFTVTTGKAPPHHWPLLCFHIL